MTDNSINFGRQFVPPGMTGQTSAPANVDEIDLPPGAAPYPAGPLGSQPSPPSPSPTPNQTSLTTLAAGGTNHQQAWMSGQPSPESFPKQAPFGATSEPDLPPGAGGTYYGGPLANPPKPAPTPPQSKFHPDVIRPFTWSSGFSEKPAY